MKRTLLILLLCAPSLMAAPVDVPAGIDHAPYDRLLKKYVSDRGLVNYAGWKASAEDLAALRDYTGKLAAGAPFAKRNERAASLINAYNALTLQWILDNYPVKSIKDTKNPWRAARHLVGGRKVSLDEIEHESLRILLGYRAHAALVCAAKSCPPLRAGAYSTDGLREQLDERMRVWLGRDDLNRFLPDQNRVELSKILDWYGKDFAKEEGGLRGVLAKYRPDWKGQFGIDFLRYDWDLNEPSPATTSR